MSRPDMSEQPDPAYRPCAGVMLLNRDGLVFVGRRIGGRVEPGDSAGWQMPQGGIDDGETPLDAARRELHEETNVASVALLAEAPGWLSYDIPGSATGWRKTVRGQTFRGQTQKWFAFRFTGPDSEIDIHAPGGGAHRPEFEAWRWVPMASLPGLIVAFKRPVYERVVEAFGPLAP